MVVFYIALAALACITIGNAATEIRIIAIAKSQARQAEALARELEARLELAKMGYRVDTAQE